MPADSLTKDALPFALTRPIHIASVGLRAKSVATLADYYREVLGLETLRASDGGVVLGAGGVALLEIEPLPPGALGDDPKSAGLFHTAFLMPTRADLGRWILQASASRIAVEGMSDHLVSEAVYLSDPEGNGIEIYADRPQADWSWDGDRLRMATERLDVEAVVRSVPGGSAPYQAAPEALRIGHVHLRVGDHQLAEDWWTSEIGLDVVTHYPGASFLSSGGYHHHIAANIWRSRGAGPRDPSRGGLSHVTLTGSGIAAERETADPWGTRIRLVPGA